MPVSTYSVRNYGNMVNDQRRTDAYVQALRQCIRPGDVVVDIGTGTGIFAFLACQLGAAKVFAIEPDDAIEVARQCTAANPHADRIEWIQGLSTELELPQLADVIVGDLHGVMPFFSGNIESLHDARDRLLKPEGRLLPGRDVLWAVPASAETEVACLRKPWIENLYAVSLREGAPYVANTWWRADDAAVPESELLADPASWGVVDYRHGNSPNVDGAVQWVADRSGTMHGYYVWFESELADGIVISNRPQDPGMVYGRAFFPLPEPVEIAVGDRIQCRFSVTLIDGEHVYRWDSRIDDAQRQRRHESRQSSFRSRPLKPGALARIRGEHAPQLNDDGQIALAVLQAMQTQTNLADIASALSRRFPQRFPDEKSALHHASGLTVRYSDAPDSSAMRYRRR